MPLTDTDPETARVHRELLRRAGPARRAEMAFSLSATVIALARAHIRRQHPDASEEEVALLFVDRHYGSDLAAGLRAHLARGQR